MSQSEAAAHFDYDLRLVLVCPVVVDVELTRVVLCTTDTIWEIEDDGLDELLPACGSGRCELGFKVRNFVCRVQPGAG